MILRSSTASPFGRKCKISAMTLGLMDKIEIKPANTMDPEDSIRQENPLGKIPILILDDGTRLYDSRVICEYLDGLSGGGNLIPTGGARWSALTLQALADGIIDAAILQVYEVRYRPEDRRHPDWVDFQQEKVQRGLAWLEANIPEMPSKPHIGHITLACALAYLDFRLGDIWRAGHPNLVAWLDRFADATPAFGDTAPYDL